MGTVYIARCRTTGKRYVGQTIRKFSQRLCEHRCPSHYGSGRYFHSAIRKYGFDDFEFIPLEDVPDRLLDELELILIQKLGTLAPRGYNLRSGGGRTGKLSPDARRKLSESLKGRKPGFAGKKHKQETRQLVSKKMKGRIITVEARKKISASLKGNVPWNKGKKGLPKASAETRSKMSESHKAMWQRRKESACAC